jgi:hypothetical protein
VAEFPVFFIYLFFMSLSGLSDYRHPRTRQARKATTCTWCSRMLVALSEGDQLKSAVRAFTPYLAAGQCNRDLGV